MEEVESRALNSFKGETPSLQYVSGMGMTIGLKSKTLEAEPFTEHIKSLGSSIKFTRHQGKQATISGLCGVHGSGWKQSSTVLTL